MANTQIVLHTIADWTRRSLTRFRHSKTGLLLASALLAAAVLWFGVIVPLLLHFDRAGIPDFPDCSGQPTPAIEYLQAAYGQALDHPTADDAVGKLGMAFQAHLFYDEAAACYKKAEELNPDEWRWFYYAALLQEELGNTGAAIEALKTVTDKQPAYPMAWFRLGNAYLKGHSFQNAERGFRQVLQLPEEISPVINGVRVPARGAFPLKAYATMQLGRTLLLEKRFAEARSLLTEVTEANPAFGPAYRLLGNVYHEVGEEKEAAIWEMRANDLESYVPPADAMYNALVLCSRNSDIITREINIAFKWQNYEWYSTLVNQILQFNPHDGEALGFKIKQSLDTRHLKDVKPLVDEYAEVYKSDEQRLLDMAKYIRQQGQYEATVTLLKRIFTLDPRNVDAHVEYVRLLKAHWQYDLGIQHCTEVLATDSQNVRIRVELIDLLILAGQLNEATEELKAEQRIHPNEQTRSLLLARMAKKKMDGKNAVSYYQRALAADPRNAAILLELGRCFMELSRWNDAAKHWERALQTLPGNVEFGGQYALLLAACPDATIRDGKRALELSQRLKLGPKGSIEQDMSCGTALAAAYAEEQQYDLALSVAREYLQLSESYRNADDIKQFQDLVSLFQSRKPYRL